MVDRVGEVVVKLSFRVVVHSRGVRRKDIRSSDTYSTSNVCSFFRCAFWGIRSRPRFRHCLDFRTRVRFSTRPGISGIGGIGERRTEAAVVDQQTEGLKQGGEKQRNDCLGRRFRSEQKTVEGIVRSTARHLTTEKQRRGQEQSTSTSHKSIHSAAVIRRVHSNTVKTYRPSTSRSHTSFASFFA